MRHFERQFQSFFCWKGHQIPRLLVQDYAQQPVSILFLLEGASNQFLKALP